MGRKIAFSSSFPTFIAARGGEEKPPGQKNYYRSSWKKKPPLVYVRKKRAARRNFPRLWKMNGEKSSSFSFSPLLPIQLVEEEEVGKGYEGSLDPTLRCRHKATAEAFLGVAPQSPLFRA